MTDEDMAGWQVLNAPRFALLRSAMTLAASILAVALPLGLFSVATERTGTAGPGGVAAATAICLFAGLAALVVAELLCRTATPLVAMLAGMGLRLTPPLVVCLVLAAQGGGREHLPFVVYLMTLYLVTLTLDTWWAVQRVAGTQAPARPRSL